MAAVSSSAAAVQQCVGASRLVACRLGIIPAEREVVVQQEINQAALCRTTRLPAGGGQPRCRQSAHCARAINLGASAVHAPALSQCNVATQFDRT